MKELVFANRFKSGRGTTCRFFHGQVRGETHLDGLLKHHPRGAGVVILWSVKPTMDSASGAPSCTFGDVERQAAAFIDGIEGIAGSGYLYSVKTRL